MKIGHVEDAASKNRPTGSIAAGAGVGAVHLSVTEDERAVRFYRDIVGLSVLSESSGRISLGVGEQELVVLHPGAADPVMRGTTGLYHLALVVPSRRELARVIARLAQRQFPQAPTDHVMTKSDYIWDPDGNGVEIYCETPEDGVWFFENGQFLAKDKAGALRSGRDPVDLDDLLGELTPADSLDEPLPEGSKMGHVHLHVADLDEAVHFYHDLVGFDVTGVAREWQVAFVSAGGYHHHLGLNTWAGEGAPPRLDAASGMMHFTVEVPTQEDLEDAVERLSAGGVSSTAAAEGFFVEDPSYNRVFLKTS